MPRWNLGQMMSDITARLGRRVDIPRSVVSRYINQAYQELVWISKPAVQERIAVSSTTSGENRIELPTDFYSIVNLSYLTNIGSSRTLRQANVHEVDATGFTPVGIPNKYVLFRSWLELYPAPDSTYSLQIRYRSFATDMLELDDIPSMDTNWRFAIVLKAESFMHQWLGDPVKAALAENYYTAHVAMLETAKQRRQTDHEGQRVRVIW